MWSIWIGRRLLADPRGAWATWYGSTWTDAWIGMERAVRGGLGGGTRDTDRSTADRDMDEGELHRVGRMEEWNGGTRRGCIGGARIRTDWLPPAGARTQLKHSPASTLLSCQGLSTSTRGASSTVTSNRTTCVRVGEREGDGVTARGGVLCAAAALMLVLWRGSAASLLLPPCCFWRGGSEASLLPSPHPLVPHGPRQEGQSGQHD